MKIELLYFDSCPSWKTGLDNLRMALTEAGIADGIDLIQVETDEDVLKRQFQGSPTIRVDGQDLFPTGHGNYAPGCRVYQTPEGLRGWPTIAMIKGALTKRGL
jgi:hypothetical protein